jgi:ABC-type multidrug transport system, ATPase and permease components
LTNDIQLFNEGMLNALVMIAQNIMSAFITMAVLFYINPCIALVVIACIIVMYFVPLLLGKAIQKQQIVLSNDLMKLTAITKSYLNGFSVIFSYLIQNTCITIFSAKNSAVTKSRMKMDQEISLSESLSAVLSVETEFIVLFLSGWGVMQGTMTIGTMVAIMQLSGAFIQPIMIIMQNVPRVIGGRSILQRFEEIIAYKPTGFCGTAFPSFNDKIELKDLSFSYDNGRPILNNINCSFEKNKKYVLVGESGSGKSTLVGLIVGFSSTYEGSILFDGVELKRLDLNQVLSLITVTQQNSFLFDSTILENITLGMEYKKDVLETVCQMCGVNKFLDEVPNGLDCNVVEGGNNLSGGQKQRISIARALLQKKPIMILDESTAAIDKKTAFDIENCLLKIPELTLITITHNLDTKILEKYDQIIFLKDAQISGVGSFSDLYNKSTEFRQFLNIAYDN